MSGRFDSEYGGRSLNETIVKYNGEFIIVDNYQRDVSNIVTKKGVIPVESGDLDLSGDTLGWFYSYKKGGFLAERKPARQWRYGLTMNNLRFPYGNVAYEDIRTIAKMMNNSLLTVEEAMEFKSCNEYNPFHREWSIQYGGSLLYYDDWVGDLKEGKLFLHEDKKYLIESLREVVGHDLAEVS